MNPWAKALATKLRVPGEPDWLVRWEALDAEFKWIRDMLGCPQDPYFHAEGDVWIHTRMVCEEMAAHQAYRQADADLRLLLFGAALLHDVAKPRSTVVQDDGRVRSPGHSPVGAQMAREILWRLGMPLCPREAICGLIRWHQVPYHLFDREDGRGVVIRMTQTARADHLTWLAQADLRGRVCEDQARQLEAVELFAEYCRELGCFDQPWPFASAHSRAMYFHRRDRDPTWDAYDDTRCEVIVMSGLPGSGKSTWIANEGPDWPVISLDELRRQMGVSPTEHQAPVVGAAREHAREYLRREQPFIWDATNLSRKIRRPLIELLYGYGARVRIVYVEAPAEHLWSRNRNRANPVPTAALERMIRRWEVPTPTEAHELSCIESS